jgi:hypothetical protein
LTELHEIKRRNYQDTEPEVPGQGFQEKEVPERGHRIKKEQAGEGGEQQQSHQV